MGSAHLRSVRHLDDQISSHDQRPHRHPALVLRLQGVDMPLAALKVRGRHYLLTQATEASGWRSPLTGARRHLGQHRPPPRLRRISTKAHAVVGRPGALESVNPGLRAALPKSSSRCVRGREHPPHVRTRGPAHRRSCHRVARAVRPIRKISPYSSFWAVKRRANPGLLASQS